MSWGALAKTNARTTASEGMLLSYIPCQNQTFEILMSWDAVFDWKRGLKFENVETIKSSLGEVGHWGQVKVEGRHITISKESPNLVQTYSLEEPACSTFLRTKIKNTANLKGFTDESLKKLLNRSKKNKTSGLIYAWSPSMTLSIRGAQEAVQVAKELGLELTVIHDSRASQEEVSQAKIKNTEKLQSFELVRRNMEIHFPSVILYKNGDIINYARPGYDVPDRLKSYIGGNL